MLGAVFLREALTPVPAAWGEAAVRAAMATVNHMTTAGVVSAASKRWTREVLKIMLLQKTTWASAVLLVVGLIAWGASAALAQDEAVEPKGPRAPTPAPRRKAEAIGPQPRPT